MAVMSRTALEVIAKDIRGGGPTSVQSSWMVIQYILGKPRQLTEILATNVNVARLPEHWTPDQLRAVADMADAYQRQEGEKLMLQAGNGDEKGQSVTGAVHEKQQ